MCVCSCVGVWVCGLPVSGMPVSPTERISAQESVSGHVSIAHTHPSTHTPHIMATVSPLQMDLRMVSVTVDPGVFHINDTLSFRVSQVYFTCTEQYLHFNMHRAKEKNLLRPSKRSIISLSL